MNNTLADQPNFCMFSIDQSKFIVTSSEDILYVDMKSGLEIDLDEREEISNIENILADTDNFYVLANKKEGMLGYYLFNVNINDPHADSEYYINWTNKLDIGNCDMHLLTNQKGKYVKKSIVVSYKCIGINTFNVFVIDLKTKLIKYWHESYQLWESKVKGFLLTSNDFMILSKSGINLLALGEKDARVVQDEEGFDRMIHALGSCNFLKIEPTNHLLFACQFYDDRQVCL